MSNSPISYVKSPSNISRLSTEDSQGWAVSGIETEKHASTSMLTLWRVLRMWKVLEFIDNGYSGTNFERPAVRKLLDQMRRAKSTVSL